MSFIRYECIECGGEWVLPYLEGRACVKCGILLKAVASVAKMHPGGIVSKEALQTIGNGEREVIVPLSELEPGKLFGPPNCSSAVKRPPLEIKISVDTSELDVALAKAEKLVELLGKANEAMGS
ncbi:hypothetical protein [Paenibacillus sp. MMO-58]|uniref:hypothetical protein n=1 Tax=Paenibacillus sp. MMO-58 TaxID=3081290 RepID=UPI00301606BB